MADGASGPEGAGYASGNMTLEQAYRILDAKRGDKGGAHQNYKKLALKWHPDKNMANENKKEAEEQMKRLNEAWKTIYATTGGNTKYGRASRSHRKRPKATRAHTAAKQRTKRARGRADS
jgi:DnaJ-class molecular chaperone